MKKLAACLLLALSGLAGCKEKEPEFYGSSVTAMDYLPTDTFVKEVYINGNWVGPAVDGANRVTSGIVLPVKWRPDLTARVKWQRCDRADRNNYVPDEEACKWHELDVPVHEYDAVLNTWVHILDDQHVLVIPSYYPPDYEGYPGPGYPEKNFILKRGIKK
jgi:hypothetical protein